MASPVESTPDHLFAMRNNFHLGSYQAAINSADSLPPLSPEESLVFRSYIALGSYPAVKLLAMYLSSPNSKESVIANLKEWLEDPAIGNNNTLKLIAGTIFMHEQDYSEALKHTNSGGTMDLLALNVQIFIKMHRGGSKIEEAYLIFQDFSEKYQMTGLVLNGKAVCCMLIGNFDEAETFVLESLNKDTKDPETLANLVVCSLHLGKLASRYLSQLKLSNPDYVMVKRVTSAEESFDRAVQTVA
ncbi:hypothetical protein MLD38_010374 [Melastoma candidum]|uniref:Uncharacterized protein n=1 Tax=Melastoma candidum TaxID=119954 RepID=A0ACB9R361_9MYRT|nr:hypothetical protein MLD38_010374 [Melastoma candidum]